MAQIQIRNTSYGKVLGLDSAHEPIEIPMTEALAERKVG